MDVEVRVVSDIKDVLALRREVFIEEQQVEEELEVDGLDEGAIHFLATAGEESVGAARLRFVEDSCKFERICVRKRCRGQGTGKEILLAMMRYAKDHFPGKLCKMDAQLSALAFYEKLGWKPRGDTFLDAGILHREMVLEDGM